MQKGLKKFEKVLAEQNCERAYQEIAEIAGGCNDALGTQPALGLMLTAAHH